MAHASELSTTYPPEIVSQTVFALLLDKGFSALFLTYICILVALPSGAIYGVNFIFPLYLLLFPCALFVFLQRRPSNPMAIALLIATPAIFLTWVVLSQFYQFGADGARHQYFDIMFTLMTCWMGAVFVGKTPNGALSLLRTVIRAEAVACAFKTALVAYALARGIPISDMASMLEKVFGGELMSMDLGTFLVRLQFVSDGLIPLCIFAVLAFRQRLRISAPLVAVMIALYVFSVGLSFSRYFWGFTVLTTLMGLTLGKKDNLFTVIVVMLTATTVALFPTVVDLFTARFSGDLSGESDLIRVEQIAALKTWFFEAPLMGHGVGTYVTTVLRAENDWKFLYEVQLLALAGQIGIAGLAVLASYCLFYFRSIWPRHLSELRSKGPIVILLLFWLAAGLFNPLLLNPVGAVSYIAILCLGVLSADKEPTLGPKKPVRATP